MRLELGEMTSITRVGVCVMFFAPILSRRTTSKSGSRDVRPSGCQSSGERKTN